MKWLSKPWFKSTLKQLSLLLCESNSNETASSLLSVYVNFNVHSNMLCTQAAGYQGIDN